MLGFYINFIAIILGEFGVVYKGHLIKDLGRTVTEVVAIKTLKGLYTEICRKENWAKHSCMPVIA